MIKALNKNSNDDFSQSIKCEYKSGILGCVAELKTSQNPNEPVNIMTKLSFVEINRYFINVY